MILGPWINITDCAANGMGTSCGPGTIMLKRNCTDGTKDVCKNTMTQKNVSCKEANVPLPECKGTIYDAINTSE